MRYLGGKLIWLPPSPHTTKHRIQRRGINMYVSRLGKPALDTPETAGAVKSLIHPPHRDETTGSHNPSPLLFYPLVSPPTSFIWIFELIAGMDLRVYCTPQTNRVAAPSPFSFQSRLAMPAIRLDNAVLPRAELRVPGEIGALPGPADGGSSRCRSNSISGDHMNKLLIMSPRRGEDAQK